MAYDPLGEATHKLLDAVTYEPLDEEKNEIRVLQFEDCWHPESVSKPLNLSLKQVSLNDFGEEFRSYEQRGKKKGSWRDAYTRELKSRSLLSVQTSSSSHATDSPHQPTSRFNWGDYEALSYRWGEKTHTASIRVNGALKEVTVDLEAALRVLHRLPETKLGMRYWIDALCINQSDTQERSHQVKRMKGIYGTARAVIVWLGPESEEDDRAIRAMKATRRDASLKHQLFLPSGFDAQDWNALYAFMKKPYWNRLWIIQELAANQESTMFLCGNRKLTRDMIKLGADCCQKLLNETRAFTRDNQSDAWSTSRRAYRLVDLKSDLPPDDMLKKALNLARQADASVKKDKVYGILGLLHKSISSRIVPDYSDKTSVQHVFTTLTMAIIQATGDLEQIVYGPKACPQEWHSWVPDLRIPFSRHHVQYLQNCRASNNRRAKYQFLNEEDILRTRLSVEGIRLDFVDGIAASASLDGPPIYPNHDPSRYSNEIKEILGRTLVMDHPKTKKHPTIMKFHWDIKNENSQSMPRDMIWTDVLEHPAFQEFDKFRKENQNFRINGRKLKNYFPRSPQKFNDHHAALNHLRLAVISLKERRLATTNTGHICLAPEAVQKGDLVVILLGCNFPVVLRPSGDVFRVLGECYVYGVMNGEVFGVQRQEGLPYQNFVLA